MIVEMKCCLVFSSGAVKYSASRSLLTYTESLDTVKRLRWRNENSPVLEIKTINRVRKVICRNTSTEQKVQRKIMSNINIRAEKGFPNSILSLMLKPVLT